jgi:hypothetical protein
LFVGSCQDILLANLEKGKYELERRKANFSAYMTVTRSLILLMLSNQLELSWTDPASMNFDPMTESAAMRRDILDRGADALGLPHGSRIPEQMASAIVTLRRHASLAYEHFLDMAYEWLQYVEKVEKKGGRPETLRSYIEARMRTHVRGTVGEFAAAFRLGPDFWLLNGPDYDVTVPGADFVVVSKRNGEIWFCDNKTLSDSSLGRVSSLVENIPENMARRTRRAADASPFATQKRFKVVLGRSARGALPSQTRSDRYAAGRGRAPWRCPAVQQLHLG